MACMFCGSQEKLTREHVFPAFMGGELSVPSGSCATCNGGFAADEAVLQHSTKTLLNLLQIENRTGVVPSVDVPAEIRGMDMTGLRAYRKGDGDIVLGDVVRDAMTPDGKPVRQGFFVRKESAEKFIEKETARGGKLIEREVPENIVIEATAKVTLPFAFSIEARRVVAKIALAAIAYELGLSFASSTYFSRLHASRHALVPKDLPVWFFADEMFMRLHTRTAHQHSVMCYLSGGMHKGWAVVTLFGGLSYLVEVSADYSESRSRNFRIFYDAATKKRFEPIVLADEQKVIGHILTRHTKFEDRDALDKQWFPLIAAVCAEKGYPVERLADADASGEPLA